MYIQNRQTNQERSNYISSFANFGQIILFLFLANIMIFGLAPMDGITDCIYRTITNEIFKKYTTNPDHELRTWTEFMNADGYMINPQRLIKHIILNDTETKLEAQIYGGNEDTLVKTAIDIEKKYPQYAGIQLNIGCPSPKVMACGAGSGMMRDKKRTLQIIKSISEAISMPFSIKVRAGLSNEDKPAQYDFLLEAAQYCWMIGIHGRVFKQGHAGFVDREMMARLKKELGDSCKIVGNGGIKSYQEHLDITQAHGLDGMMTAQAAIANPWVFVPHEPSIQDKYETAMRHAKLLAAYELYFEQNKGPEYSTKQLVINRLKHAEKNVDTAGEDLEEIGFHDYVFPMPTLAQLEDIAANLGNHNLQGLRSCVEYRKFLFNYVKGIEGSKEFKREVAQTRDYTVLFEIMKKFFEERV